MIAAANLSGDLVLFDTKRDSYRCIAPPLSDAIWRLIGQDRPRIADLPLVEGLRAQGIDLVRCRRADPNLTKSRRDPGQTLMSGSTSAQMVIRMAIAAGLAGLRLRGLLRRFEPTGAIEADNISEGRVLALVASFNRLRPLIPGIGRCLPQSLTLRDFLGLHGVESEIVFGVRSGPFEAHCWVERDGVVLNDTVDHVRWFTPIFAC